MPYVSTVMSRSYVLISATARSIGVHAAGARHSHTNLELITHYARLVSTALHWQNSRWFSGRSYPFLVCRQHGLSTTVLESSPIHKCARRLFISAKENPRNGNCAGGMFPPRSARPNGLKPVM